MSRIVVVAAVAKDSAIGKDNTLLWHIPEDMARFRAITAAKPVVMGRLTWDSLPAKVRPLPGRRNLVVSRSVSALPGAEVFAHLDAALAACATEPEVCIIGGSDIYRLAMPVADTLALTEVDATYPHADRHFPEWPRDQFVEAFREEHVSTTGLGFAWVDYRRTD